jgi:sulfonate transport system substrate-binding protein
MSTCEARRDERPLAPPNCRSLAGDDCGRTCLTPGPERQSGAKILADGSNHLASYKRYYLASEKFVQAHGDVLKIFYQKLEETGRWAKAKPKEAAALLAKLWGIDAETVEQSLRNRTLKVGPVTYAGLAEQQKIADAFVNERILPKELNTADVKIWSP